MAEKPQSRKKKPKKSSENRRKTQKPFRRWVNPPCTPTERALFPQGLDVK
jgi:hypothetical protein